MGVEYRLDGWDLRTPWQVRLYKPATSCEHFLRPALAHRGPPCDDLRMDLLDPDTARRMLLICAVVALLWPRRTERTSP